jgi:exonuclease V gamma subunit
MSLGSSFPAKIICAIGCDEGSFPRNRPPSCLENDGTLKEMPSIIDQDRYLFLEMILNARVAFICSYQRMSLKDQKEQGPSFLIQDLMSDLDKNCFFLNSDLKPSQVFTRHHPAIHFDKSYFQEKGFCSFSPYLFSLAQTYYGKDKTKIPPFCVAHANKIGLSKKTVEIKKIKAFGKDPMQLYLKETLGIFFDFISPKEEEFFLSPLMRSRIKKEALQKGLSSSIRLAAAKGQLPLGKMGQLAVEDLKEDLEQWHESLEQFGVRAEEIFSLQLSEDAKEIERKEGKMIAPALSIEIEGICEVSLVGEMEFLCSKGFLVLSKLSKARHIELLPSVLILMCLSKKFDIEPKALLLETGKTFSLFVEDPLTHLKRYIKLYFRCLEEMCPIRPEWALDFLTKTRSEIEKKRSSSLSFKSFVDPYEEWMMKRGAFPELEEMYSVWEKDWKQVFSPLLEAQVK